MYIIPLHRRLLVSAIFSLFLVSSIEAQSVWTTVATQFDVDRYTQNSHSFAVGDSVEVFAFKKKSGKFHFALQSGDYVANFALGIYPFTSEQKQLKKLPDALCEDIARETMRRKDNIYKRHAALRKVEAMQGKVRGVVESTYLKDMETGKFIPLKQGDTVCVLGYKEEGREAYYAIYSDEYAGFCTASAVLKPHIKRGKTYNAEGLDMQYMPSTDDADVQKEITRRRVNIQQREAEKAERRHAYIMQGRERAVLSYSYSSLSCPDYDSCPFNSNDTVSVVGYSLKDDKKFYALFSDKGAGIFSTSKYSDPFKRQFDMTGMPAVDAPEVLAVISQKKQTADSLAQVRLRESEERLISTKKALIETLQQIDPVFVTVDSWETDYAGGVSMNISVTNGSPTQTIKYISFQGYFTNAVGDKCYNEIGGGTTWKTRGIGPIGPRPTSLENFDARIDNCQGSYSFDNIRFYSEIAQYIHVTIVTIQYMNGKTITLSGERLKKHLSYE